MWQLLLDPSKVNCFDQVEDPRYCSRRGVGGIIYAHGARGHTDYCGNRMSDNPIRAHNPPHSWTGTVDPSLPDFTIALVWIPYCAIGQSGGLSLSFKTVLKSKVRVCIYTIAFELFYSSLG
jgi:hypothetical protein